MKINEIQKRFLSFILVFLMMFSIIHPVFANARPESKEELEISDEKLEISDENLEKSDEELEISDGLIEPEKLSIQAFNKLSAVNKEEFPSDLDETKIETIVSEWITKDSVEDNDEDSLNQVWEDNEHQIIRMRINYALSGQHDYPEGSVNIEIPKNIVKDRNGKFTGSMNLAVPQAPDKSGLFSYIDNGDTYILTNTKKLPATTSGTFEMTIRDLKPSDIKDKATGYVTDEFKATISVNTKEDNIIQKTSNSLTANFDTFAKISGAYKNVPYNPTDVYPFNFPSELKPTNSDKYAYVAYDVHAYSEANQPFSVSIQDNSYMDVEGDVIILGYEDTRTGKITKGDGTNQLNLGIVDSEYLNNGQNFFGKVYVAYSKDNMESEVSYKLSNNIEYTMTALDDKEVTKSFAKSTKEFMLLKFEPPTGHFCVEKYGRGSYNFALNLLKDGKEVDTEYRVYTKGFGYKWTRPLEEDADDINSYGKVDYSMITTDYETRLFSTQDKVLDNEDFYFKKLRIVEPNVYDYGKYEKNGYGYYENNDKIISYGPISQGYYGYILTKDYSKYPDLKVSISKDGTNFIEYATFSYKTGKPVFTKTDGSVINGDTIEFPKDTIDYKVELTTKAPAVLYDMYPTVTLKPSKYVKENIDKLFKETDTPNTYGLNKVKLDTVLHDTPTPINTMQDNVVLNSFKYGSRLTKSVSYDGTSEAQKQKQNIKLSYSSTFTSQTNINMQTREDLQTVIKAGLYKEEKAQTWYDLLPRGVAPDTDTIKISNGKVLDVEVIENYRNSGRIMLVVKTETEPRYSYTLRDSSILGQDGYRNDITLSFDANYSWMNLSDYGDILNNLIAYESENTTIGNTTGLEGEPDDPSKGFNKYSKTAIKEDEVELMKDLNKDHDNNSFVYANAEAKLIVDTHSLTSLHKQVDVNREGLYGDGLDNKLAKNVYENGRYSYRLRFKNTNIASSKNIKLYDSLENYVPTEDKDDFGDIQWKGQFLSIDVSQLKAKGINPVVYYSTKSGLVLDDTDNREDLDLSNENIWSTQVPTDKSKITAIAIDASKDLNGNDYELPVDESISAFIHMKAPKVRDLETDPSKYELYYDKELGEDEKEAGLTGGAHAYNNVSSTHISISKVNGKESDELLVIYDYVKVGLKPYNIEAKIEFNDDNNRDGIRDKEVTIRLFANGVKTNHTITLNEDNNFTDKFINIEYLDDNAKPIYYTLVEENTNEKYQFKIKDVKESENGKSFIVENYYEPERISIKGIKTWQDDDLTVRPLMVKLALYENGRLVQTINFGADIIDGNWDYSFNNLFKYENGKEIEYEVKEFKVPHGYYVEETEDGLVNKYYPYGDVKLSKEVINKTDKTNNREFTFTFYAKNKTTGEYDTSKYEYVKSNGETGTIMTGSEFILKDGQEIHIKDIHIDNEVSFKEKDSPGYRLTSNLKTDVKVKEISELKAVSEYFPKVSLPIKGTKIIEGRKLESYQFIFDIYNEDGKIIKSGSNRKNGDILFGSLEYSYEDLEKGTFNYTIRERQTELKGYIIDEHVEEFSVTIEDNGDGTMTATPKFDSDGIVFSNKYEAKGDVNLIAYKRSATKFEDEVSKEIPASANDKLMNEYLFDFELVDKETGKVVSKGQNDKNGKITFDKLEFNQDDIGKTFVYLAREIKGNYEDVIYDETQIEYTVKVSDNGDGTLSFDIITKDLFTEDLGNEETVPTFGNKFKPGTLEVSKFITNGDPGKEFKFKIKFNGEEHLIPNGEFELNRKNVDSPYKVIYEVSEGKAPDNVYLYDKEGEYEIILPGENKIWATVDEKIYKSGDTIKYIVDNKGNITFEDSNIKVDNEGNIKFKMHYSEDGVIGISKDQEFYWGEDNPFGTEKKGDKLTGIYKNSTRNLVSNFVNLFRSKISKAASPTVLYSGTDGGVTWEVFDNNELVFRPTNGISGTFNDMTSPKPWNDYEVDLIRFEEGVKGGTNLSYMFYRSQATSIDLSNFDTSNVTNMSYMFYDSKATSIDLSSFDTSNVTDMRFMFRNSQATSLDLSNFDTSKVTNMSYMFSGSQATSLDLSNFVTSNVTNMNSMFYQSQATSLNLSSFDTSKVTNMSYMFYQSQAASLDLSNFDTSNVTNMYCMFYQSQATSLDVSNFDTSNVTDMGFMFRDSQAASLILKDATQGKLFVKEGSLTTDGKTITYKNSITGTDGGVTWEIFGNNELVFRPTNGVEGTFNNMSNTSPKPWNDYNVNLIRFEEGVKGGTNLSYMFYNSQATSIDLSNFDTSNVTDMRYMFRNSQATSLNLSNFDTSNVTNMYSMFYQSQATSIDLSNFDTSKVTNMSYMFSGSQATSLDLSNFDTSKVTNMYCMFYQSQATSLDVSNFDTSNVTDMSYMFRDSQATSIDVSSFDTSKVTSMVQMFRNSKATSLILKDATQEKLFVKKGSLTTDGKTITYKNSITGTDGGVTWEVSNNELVFRPTNGVEGTFNNMSNTSPKPWNDYNVNLIRFEEGVKGGTNLSYMFYYSQATSIDLSNFDTSNVTNMYHMFYRSQTTSIDLSSFDTSKVTNMSFMFQQSQATSLDLSNFNTSNVTDMHGMFSGSQATSIDLSSFDTSNITNMSYMFRDSKATSIDLSSFDTSNITDMSYMFSGSQATSLDLSSFDTSNVTNMSYMFYNSQATSLNLSSFDTSNVTDMYGMFYDSKATSIDLSSFDTSNVTDMRYMFRNSQATSLDLSNFDTSNVTNMYGMFYGSQATSINLSNFDTSKVTNMSYMFNGSQATSLNLSSFDTSKVTNMSYMFRGSQATSLNLSNFDTSNVTDMSYMFSGSQAISIDLSNFDTSKVTNMSYMFSGSQATSLNLSSFNTSNVTNMDTMFYDSQATSIDLSSFDTSNVTDMETMFYRSQATSLDLSNFDTSNVTNMRSMFGYSQATSIDVSKFNTSKITSMSYMFTYSQATSLDLSSFDTSNVTDMDSMFFRSQATSIDLSSFDTSNVTNMGGMFYGSQATSLDLSSFDTSNVKYMSGIFRDSQATSIDLSSFVTSNVTNMSEMFYGSQATSLDLSSFDTSNVTNMSEMFYGSQATSLDLSSFDTSNVTNMSEMFYGSQATSIDLSSFVTSNVTDMSYMFRDSQATSLDLSNFDTFNVTNMYEMFRGSQATSIDVSSFDTSNVTSMLQMFRYSQVTSLDVSSFDTSKATTTYMFRDTNFDELILSDKFKSLLGTILPDKPETATTTGKWIRDDKVYGPWTSAEFMANYSPEKAGRYILEPKAQQEYNIIFDSNGNNGSVSPIVAKKGEDVIIPSGDSIYSLTKRFVKWNTQPDGTGTDYLPGNKYKDLSTPGKDITLYAIMEDRENTLNIKDGEATFTLRHGESITLDNLPKGLSYEIYEESESGWRLVETRNTEGVIESNETHKSTFINAYEPGTTSVQLNARKNLDGLGKEGFTFNLIENGKIIQTKESQSSGNIQFDPLVYREPGIHTYTIKEVVGDDNTINYDTHEETVIVRVTEDAKGDLVTTVAYDDDGVVFNNTTKEVELTVTKKVQNTTKQDTFYFDVTINGQTERIELKAEETKKLSGIKINSTYEVKEVNIDKDYEVVGNVSQSGILDKNINVTITNKYNPTLDFNFNLEVKKNLEGRELKANEFSFIVIDEFGKTIAESSNDINGKVEFGLIPVTKLGTSIFKVKELPGSDTNIEYDNVERTIEITASDTKIEEIKFYEADKEIQELVFNNKYTPKEPEIKDPKFGNISITKNVLNETETIKDKEYEVEVSIKDKDNKDIDKEFAYTSNKGLSNIVKNKDVIKIKNDETITINHLPEGTKISIRELVPEGFTLLEDISKLEDTIVADQTVELNLVNDYTPTGSFRFKGNKSLLGREIKDYRFTFTVIKDGDVLQKVNNDETGNILFEDIVLTKEDIGKTYKYQIVEDDDKQRNIVYDQKIYEIEVTVTDDGKGNIIATYADPEITFTNAHREMPQTGFNYNVYIPILILVLAGVLIIKKKKNS
jgi:pilin isopeptide linkage protein